MYVQVQDSDESILRQKHCQKQNIPMAKATPAKRGKHSPSKSVFRSQQVQDIKSKNNRTKRKTHKPTIIREILTRLSVK